MSDLQYVFGVSMKCLQELHSKSATALLKALDAREFIPVYLTLYRSITFVTLPPTYPHGLKRIGVEWQDCPCYTLLTVSPLENNVGVSSTRQQNTDSGPT